MRTTLDIDDALLAEAKAVAARERTSLTRLIEEGLKLRLQAAGSRGQVAERFRMPVFDGGSGLAPGIDPCSNQSLLEATESDEELRRRAGLEP